MTAEYSTQSSSGFCLCFTGTLAFDLKGLGKGQKVLLAKAEMNKKYLNTVTNKEVFVVNYKLFFSAHQSKIVPCTTLKVNGS